MPRTQQSTNGAADPGGGAGGAGAPNYADRIGRLKNRLDNPGANKNKLRSRIGDLRSQKYLAGQKNQPDSSLPFDAEYDTTVSGLNRNRDVSLQNTGYERQMTQSNYGFDNPLANPYSKAALLQRSYDQAERGTVNGAAAQGDLYSGSTQRALDNVLFNYGQQYNSAQSEYQDKLRSLTDADLATNNTYGDSMAQAEASRLAKATSTDVDPSEAPALPGSVNKYVKGQRKQLRKLTKSGRDNQADKLRAKLKKLGVGSGR